jgi:hypothetical protein
MFILSFVQPCSERDKLRKRFLDIQDELSRAVEAGRYREVESLANEKIVIGCLLGFR